MLTIFSYAGTIVIIFENIGLINHVKQFINLENLDTVIVNLSVFCKLSKETFKTMYFSFGTALFKNCNYIHHKRIFPKTIKQD